MQTLRDDDIPPLLREAFIARLIALAEAHDILTAENWDGAELRDLLAKTVGIYRQDRGQDRISLEGPAIRLQPKSAIAFAMAIHELATNAVKFGALSSATGRIDVRWEVTHTSDAPSLRVTWIERGGPLVSLPTSRGFGSRLIERGLAGQLNGSARIDFDVEGVACTIEAPLEGLSTAA